MGNTNTTHTAYIPGSQQEANVDVNLWRDHMEGTNKLLWPNSVVPYSIDVTVKPALLALIQKAINEFNTKTPVQWIPKNNRHNNWVIFKQINKKNPQSQCIGKQQSAGAQWVQLPFPYYPNYAKLQMICIMHEMMHVLGFHHEQSRKDADYHCASNKHKSYAHLSIPFGPYDYQSIMHYRDGLDFKAKNKELSRLADRSSTFAEGDLAVLRRIYGKQTQNKDKLHIGRWHEECSLEHGCTEQSCKCGACGQLSNGLNCGYEGMKGHWSCCMKEDSDAYCNDTHTGCWHRKCDDRCTDKYCYCKSCGVGCTYVGYKAHWNCCNNEAFASKCANSYY